jgi:thiol:disulfide interchange protein DsbD
MRGISILIFGLSCFNLFAQGNDAAKWKYEVTSVSNCEVELVFTATMEKGWHLYSQLHTINPLSFEFDPSVQYQKIGNVTEPTPHKEYDDLFQSDVFYFKESLIVFRQKIKLNTSVSAKATGKIYGQVCQYETGICMPLGIDFSFDLPICPYKGAST